MQLSDFTITTELKQPTNTIGVHHEWYFGLLDGVEVGEPCLIEDESRADVLEVLHKSEPISLEEMLQENIALLDSYLTDGTRLELNGRWRKERDKLSALLEKVQRYKAA